MSTLSQRLGLLHYLRLRSIPNRPTAYFKYVTGEVAKIILVNCTLRWSSPERFNDPFDVQRDLDFGFDLQELNGALVKEITDLVLAKEAPDLSLQPATHFLVQHLRRSDRADLRGIILAELPELISEGSRRAEAIYRGIKDQWSAFIPEFRILCLSAAQDNPVMWSHYSDSHRGAVLELHCTDKLRSPWSIAEPVTYQSSAPMLATVAEWAKMITGQTTLHPTIIFTKYACTKSPEWAYEREWRVISFARRGEQSNFADYQFYPPDLSAVYLGCEIPDEDANDILGLLKHDFEHVRAYRAKKCKCDRKLLFERIK